VKRSITGFIERRLKLKVNDFSANQNQTGFARQKRATCLPQISPAPTRQAWRSERFWRAPSSTIGTFVTPPALFMPRRMVYGWFSSLTARMK
jgi:hypothetical protein